MSCISCSESSSYPDYLNRVIKEIEAGDDESLKNCLCNLRTPVDLEGNPITYEENGKTVTTLFPFCVTAIDEVDEILPALRPIYCAISAKALMSYYWKSTGYKLTMSSKLKEDIRIPKPGCFTPYCYGAPEIPLNAICTYTEDVSETDIEGSIAYEPPVDPPTVKNIKDLVCLNFNQNQRGIYRFKGNVKRTKQVDASEILECAPGCNQTNHRCISAPNGVVNVVTIYDFASFGVYYVQDEETFYIGIAANVYGSGNTTNDGDWPFEIIFNLEGGTETVTTKYLNSYNSNFSEVALTTILNNT